MLITDKIIYYELQKTGSTHTRQVLAALHAGNCIIKGKHNSGRSLPRQVIGDFSSKLKVGNIRNPWDWYVSLWASGCMHRGGLFQRLTYQPGLTSWKGWDTIWQRFIKRMRLFPDVNRFYELYADAGNVQNFREWLKLILVQDKISIGEKFKESAIADAAGLYTYRYLKLYTYTGKKVRKIRTMREAVSKDRQYNFIDLILRNETLHAELVANARLLGSDPETVRKVLRNFSSRINRSYRKNYQYYYDQETAALVAAKEKLIIDKFNYSFEKQT
ncbi:MAG TPA: hypothetical protein VKS21_13120 [Spirochaetota bacterium]|nr:hypothetical protein [Spirochaetota bacterium]